MAAGALSMAAGAQELACCAQGCMTGAGTGSTAAQQGLTNAAQGAASGISNGGDAKGSSQPAQRIPSDLPKRFPDSARSFQCPAPNGIVFQLFRSQPAQASGCADGVLALLTGGLMMAMGLMGMQGAQQAGANADQAYQNYGNLSGIPNMIDPYKLNGPGNPNDPNNPNNPNTPGKPTSPNGTNLGGNSNSQPIKIDPALLNNGKANEVMTKFEDKFGIPRNQFAEAVAAGKDPRDILANAPKNPLSPADVAKAMSGANNLSDAQKAAALDKAGLKEMQAEMLAAMGDPANVYAGGGGGGKLSKPKSLSLDDLGLAGAEEAAADKDDLGLSPEVQAALAARELASQRSQEKDFTLFQLVHRKYREKTKMIFGYGVKDSPGVADANGF